jgi:D-amino peptidase
MTKLLLFGLICLSLEAANHPRVLLIYDMEGISGVMRSTDTQYGRPGYEQARESLTSNVNAAIRGLVAGGAGQVIVEDGHGSGNNKEPDVLLAKLDPRATFEFRDRWFDSYSTGIDGSFDAIVCVGQHARAHTKGFLPHTYTVDVAWNVNGVDLTETHLPAIFGAAWGIPVIMVSGDNVLKEQLAPEFPEMVYAMVKTAKSVGEAEPLPEPEKRIEAAATEAMTKFLAGKFRPYYLLGPYEFRLNFAHPEEAQMAMSTRGVVADGDSGVRFSVPTFADGFRISLDAIDRGIDALPLLVRLLQQQPNGKEILTQWQNLLFDRVNPDSVPAWAFPPATGKPAEKPKYWGGR